MFRKTREAAATLAGTSFNSVSKIDSSARSHKEIQRLFLQLFPSLRLLFPLTFLLFNLLYWTHYAGKLGRFDWDDHKITGNMQ